MTTTTLRTVHDHDFAEVVLGASGPVLVDFTADWCGPCRQVTPVLEQLATELPWLGLVRLDVDRDPVTASAYRVQGLPTLLVFVDGEVALAVVGARPASQLRRLLEPLGPASS